MMTKYGEVSDKDFCNYLDFQRKQIWKLIPLKQEECTTISSCIERINRTLCGLISTYHYHVNDMITIISLLENAKTENNFGNYRSDILKCCRILQNIIKKFGDLDVQ